MKRKRKRKRQSEAAHLLADKLPLIVGAAVGLIGGKLRTGLTTLVTIIVVGMRLVF